MSQMHHFAVFLCLTKASPFCSLLAMACCTFLGLSLVSSFSVKAHSRSETQDWVPVSLQGSPVYGQRDSAIVWLPSAHWQCVRNQCCGHICCTLGRAHSASQIAHSCTTLRHCVVQIVWFSVFTMKIPPKNKVHIKFQDDALMEWWPLVLNGRSFPYIADGEGPHQAQMLNEKKKCLHCQQPYPQPPLTVLILNCASKIHLRRRLRLRDWGLVGHKRNHWHLNIKH